MYFICFFSSLSQFESIFAQKPMKVNGCMRHFEELSIFVFLTYVPRVVVTLRVDDQDVQ